MKDTFPGYYKPSEIELQRLWDNCIFTLDANVLLNLYRYSAETNSEIIHNLQQVSDRLWIPYNAALEYHQRRLEVIESQEDSYLDLLNFLENTKNELKERLVSDNNSYLSDQLIDKVVKIFNDIEEKLKSKKDDYLSLFENDELKNAISKLMERKVGPQYSEEQLNEIYNEGEVRYAKKIPPGYLNGESKLDRIKYNNLVIWKQIIDKARSTYKPILFLSDKKTEDWWLKFRNRIIGPRPELIREIKDKANVQFHMYRIDPFMESSQKYLELSIKQEAIEEVQKFRERDDKSLSSKAELAKQLRYQREAVINLSKELEELANQTEVFNLKEISKALKQYKGKQKITKEDILKEVKANTEEDFPEK